MKLQPIRALSVAAEGLLEFINRELTVTVRDLLRVVRPLAADSVGVTNGSIDWRIGNNQTIDLGIDTTLVFDQHPEFPGSVYLRVVMTNGGGWTLTFPGEVINGASLTAGMDTSGIAGTLFQLYFDGSFYWGTIIYTGPL